MREIEVPLLQNASLDQADTLVEDCCQALGLRQTLKGTLKQYPGCTHWHYKQGSEKGTLEITLWREQRRLWFKISAGRTGVWIEPAVLELWVELEATLNINKRSDP